MLDAWVVRSGLSTHIYSGLVLKESLQHVVEEGCRSMLCTVELLHEMEVPLQHPRMRLGQRR